jgi:hypothetical protein
MAINKNHEFEELNGIKCAIVEKNCNSERVHFLKELLEWNNYTVVVAESPAAKAAPAAAKAAPETAKAESDTATAAPGIAKAAPEMTKPAPDMAKPAPVTEGSPSSVAGSELPSSGTASAQNSVTDPIPDTPVPPPPSTFTVGVTDLTFNPINAIFGRILKTKDNRIVTQAYWKQQVTFSNDEIPYFELKKV